MTAFDQQRWTCRCEWGSVGLAALAPSAVVIIVDVLSFSTCVEIAVARGAEILPFAWRDASAQAFADAQGAMLAGPRGSEGYSLSPATYLAIPRGLRCVLPSRNGASLTLEAARASGLVLAGCFRNARAVAAVARGLGETYAVCPAGERWPDGSLRPALEDWVAAGTILASLSGTKSPEAEAAIAASESWAGSIGRRLAETSSGRELVEQGFGQDVVLASALDVSSAVPRFDRGTFRAVAE